MLERERLRDESVYEKLDQLRHKNAKAEWLLLHATRFEWPDHHLSLIQGNGRRWLLYQGVNHIDTFTDVDTAANRVETILRQKEAEHDR